MRVGAKVVPRPIGTALPLGMAGLAIASFVLTGLELGWIARSQAPSAGVIVLALLAAGALIAGSAAAVGLSKLLPAVVFALTGVRFALTGVHHLTGGGGWQTASGALGIAIVVCAVYAVWAFELEAARGAPVLPTLRRFPR